MSHLERFAAYAAAFEESYADDNWQRLEQYFTEDAVYLPGDGTEAVGRDNVFAALRNSINGLDRRFDSRGFGNMPDPTEEGDVVTLNWVLIFTKQGAPDLTISGVERLNFDGDRISRMEDIFDNGVMDNVGAWMAEHGESLN